MDLVIAEGYKQEDRPKIAVYRNANANPMPVVKDKNLIAVMSDTDIEVDVPKMDHCEVREEPEEQLDSEFGLGD